MQAADLKSIGLQYRSKMSLAPIIERYMSLKRQESTLCSEFISMTRNTPLPLEDYTEILGVFTALLALLRDEEKPSLAQTYLAYIESNGAELAALDEVMTEIARKTQETRAKCTYKARPPIVLKLSESTSRVLTSSVAEIARKKREIEVVLQQM